MKRTIGISLILGTAVLLLTALLIQIRYVPSLSSIKKSFRSDNLTVLDRNGQVIDEVVKNKGVRRLNWVSLGEVAPAFLEAVKANETWRFSRDSITVQLAQSRFWPSVALEMVWSQKQILEAYINLSLYRGELQGIAAASQALFDKEPAQLTRAQSAVLAALIRSKGQGVMAAESKACKLLKVMNAAEECGLVNANHLTNLERSYQVHPFVKMAPHVARLLERDADLREGNIVRSTLDRDLQWSTLNAFQKRGIEDGAAIVIENSSGDVLAYMGNTASGRDAVKDLAREARVAGLTLKPFLFAKALDERTLTASTVIDEKPEEIRLRKAVQTNLKLPAIRALELVGVETFVQTLNGLGFSGLKGPEFYGPSLALGLADVRLTDLANAYRALANKGEWSHIKFSPLEISEEAPRRVFSEGAAFIISQMLQESLPGQPWAAVYCDQWCVGFSEKYTVAVANGGKEVWREIMNSLHRSEDSQSPLAPTGLRQRFGEWFLDGTDTETKVLPKAQAGVGSRITYPIDRARITVDPERPKDFERLYFQVAAPGTDQNLYLDGKRLGRAHALQQWRPVAGSHNLELRDSRGRVLHAVNFSVVGLSE